MQLQTVYTFMTTVATISNGACVILIVVYIMNEYVYNMQVFVFTSYVML